MPDDIGGPERGSDAPQRLGILLANLGTPDAPTPSAVRRFLAEFLWDPRVVETPRWLWWLALHGVILRIRPAKSAHAYQQIWTPQGSPLLLHGRALTTALQQRLPSSAIALGMSYGSPSIPQALGQLRQAGADRLIILPLYPQYSATTTGSVFDQVSRELQQWRQLPELRFITGYHDEAAYIDALASSIRDRWRERERSHLLFSFHGIPQRYGRAGDPYEQQCRETAQRVAARMDLSAADWSIAFQSQMGREEWLRPYTDAFLIQQARTGHKRISVICPGFTADCLETLEEIAIRNRHSFLKHGGEYFDYIPALNADEAHAHTLAGLIRSHAAGWMDG